MGDLASKRALNEWYSTQNMSCEYSWVDLILTYLHGDIFQ